IAESGVAAEIIKAQYCDGMFAWFGSRHRRRQVRDLREQRLVHEMAVEQEPDPDDERTDDGKVDRLLYASTTVMVFITLLRNNLVGPGNNYGNEKSQAQDEQENRQGPVRQLQRADHHLRNLQQQPRDRGIRDGDTDYVTLLQFLPQGRQRYGRARFGSLHRGAFAVVGNGYTDEAIAAFGNGLDVPRVVSLIVECVTRFADTVVQRVVTCSVSPHAAKQCIPADEGGSRFGQTQEHLHRLGLQVSCTLRPANLALQWPYVEVT